MSDLVDRALEATVVGSFTRIGSAARRRLDDWTPVTDLDLSGRRVVVTGATSGLGRAAADLLAAAGADLVVLGRTREKLDDVARTHGTSVAVHTVEADMGELDEVVAAADEILAGGGVDAVIHNAGALTADRRTTSAGHEATIASQVYGPFLLTHRLLDALRASDHGPGRVITVSSGGMYTAPLDVDGLEMSPADYSGTDQYARAKRAQVTLNELWAVREPAAEVVFHAMHPGWADTPGVTASLPTFRRVVGPLLRSAEDGADTMVWLAGADRPATSTGDFWLDRRVRSLHKLSRTRITDTPAERARLWDRCDEVTRPYR